VPFLALFPVEVLDYLVADAVRLRCLPGSKHKQTFLTSKAAAAIKSSTSIFPNNLPTNRCH
jgi:hypothetical protein